MNKEGAMNLDRVKETDMEVAQYIEEELERQQNTIELIASENFTSPAVMQACGSVLTNKYAEGKPHKRYYNGCEVVDKIEELITDKTSAIVAVHVYGNVCNVEKIEQIAKKHNLKVIYDAAHAFGVKYKGKDIGNFGDISMMSFHATKVFHTIEGGALLYNDSSLKDKINSLRNFGYIPLLSFQ